MSNNKQSMKLYTEEQLKEAFNCGRLYLGREGDTNFYHLIDKLTPIKLPSDEEIKQESERLYPLTGDVSIDYINHLRKKGFIDGMEWMRDKIQGGNK